MIAFLTAPALALAISLSGPSSIPTSTSTLDTEPTALTQLPDGDLLVGQSNGQIWRIDSNTGQRRAATSGGLETACLGVHPVSVGLLAADPTGNWVAAGDESGRIALWSTKTVGTEEHAGYRTRPDAWFRPDAEVWSNSVSDFAWTPSGKYLVSWRQGLSPVKLWDLKGQLLWTGPVVIDLAIHPIEDTLVWISDGGFWERSALGEVTAIALKTAKPDSLLSVAFSPSGKQLAVGTNARELFAIDAATHEVCWSKTLNGMFGLSGRQEVAQVEWSPNGRWIGLMYGPDTLWPAAVEGKTGDLICGELFIAGGMGGIHWDFEWSPDNRIVTGWTELFALDVETEKRFTLTEFFNDTFLFTSDGVTWVGNVNGKLQAIDTKTGEVKWTR